MLYIVSTPIGNLSDITLRAIDVLKNCDAILCEDTRVSKVLLNAHGIHTPLISYHSFNEKKRLEDIIERLKSNESIALISDAGTPLIQDPGFMLIQACQENSLEYTTIPGASSILSALVLSGFSVDRFQFLGFAPKKQQETKKFLEEACCYDGLSVFFESPKRVEETLSLLCQINSEASLCVVREITKKFETVHKGPAKKLLSDFQNEAARGEIVFVIQGSPKQDTTDYTQMALDLMKEGVSAKSAYTIFSKLGPVKKDLLYKAQTK